MSFVTAPDSPRTSPHPLSADQGDTSHQQWGAPLGQPQGTGVGVHRAAPLGTPWGNGVRQGAQRAALTLQDWGGEGSPAESQGHAQHRSPAQPFLCLRGFNGTTHPGVRDSVARGGTTPHSPRGQRGTLGGHRAGRREHPESPRDTSHAGAKTSSNPQQGPHVSPGVPKVCKAQPGPQQGVGGTRSVTSSHLPMVTPGRVTSRSRCSPGLFPGSFGKP